MDPLIISLVSACAALVASLVAPSETHADVENITRLSQAILKREWERVKRGV